MTARRRSADDAPLLAWGEALRAEKKRRIDLRRRIAVAGAGVVASIVE